MEKGKTFMWAESIGILTHNQRVILGNTDSGEWIKISQECYHILQKVMQQQYTVQEVLNALQTEEDKVYMSDLIEKMFKLGVVTQSRQEKGEIPRYITFAITNRCNLRCKHCSVMAGDLPDALNLEGCKKVVEKILTLKPLQIVFTGGEPLLKKGIIQLLEYTRERFNGTIGIMTNGTLFTKENISKIIPLVDSIDISIDGIDEDTCALIRGQGVFSKVVNAVELIQEEGFKNFSLSMVLTRENQPHTQEFYKLNQRLGTKPMLRAFSPIGRGGVNRSELEIDRTEENLQESKIDNSDMKVCSCGALKRILYVDYSGNMFPCPVLFDKKYSMGNILEQKDLPYFFAERAIEKRSNYKNFLGLYPQNCSECKDCDVDLFCWSCLHHIDMLQKGIINKYPNCEARKRQLQNIIWEED